MSGASGTISVTSNVIPFKIKDEFLNYKKYYARERQPLYQDITDALFIEVNPIPLKAMVEVSGRKGYELRLPLTRSKEEYFDVYKKLLKKYDEFMR